MYRIFTSLKKKNILFLYLTGILFSGQVICQTPDKIPTPQEITNLLPGNIDPTQLTQKNFKTYFSDKNKDRAEGTDKNKLQQNKTDEQVVKNTTADNIKGSETHPEETYGANIFKSTAVTNIAELSTPPLDYPIGVGDHIVVAIWGGGEYQEDYVVAKDGSIFPTGLGKITVQGLTFDNARSLIYSRFKSVVPASTNVQVTLGQPRTISVNAGGEVVNPGPVTVSAFSNALNVISMAGGITQYGNLREIQVKRAGRIVETLDVYEYLTSGDIGKHIYLQNNDFVLVKFYEKSVLASGQFKRPMYYQLKKNEGIKALIRYTGGFTTDALTSGVKVIRSENEEQVIHDVNATAIIKLSNQDYLLADGDVVKADLIKPGILNKVQLKGDVNYPGIYELRRNDRLFDVIDRAGGITGSTYLHRAYIFRAGKDSANLKVDKIEISLEQFNKISGNENNVLLQANDVIQLFSNNDFADQQSVEISGEVRKAGRVDRYNGMTLQDLIYLSGGLKSSAEFGRIEVVSIVDVDSAKHGLKPTRTIVNSYNILPNLELDSVSAKVLLNPFDQVFIRKNPIFRLQQNISVNGLVKYPGTYSKISENERISSFIERAGGVLENANLSGAILIRNKTDLFREKIIANNLKNIQNADAVEKLNSNIKGSDSTKSSSATDNARLLMIQQIQSDNKVVSIDLAKALADKNSANDIVLQENDEVFVPEKNPFVSVMGAVQSPLKITYDRRYSKLLYYIDKAGGYGIKPWRKRVYVTYANGKSKRTKNLFFVHFYPKIKEGCIINVPVRPEGKEVSDILLQSITAVLPIVIAGIILKRI
jgi:protein involved in polysaccharide export with SLBB domain